MAPPSELHQHILRRINTGYSSNSDKHTLHALTLAQEPDDPASFWELHTK